MASLSGAEAPRFTRDRLTWLTYISLSAYAFYLYALGPVLAFLHQEMHLSYTVTSVHSTIFSIGAVITGLTFDRFTRRAGRHRVFWLSAGATAVGALLFVVGHQVAVTLLAAFVLGIGCTYLGAGCSVALADRHGVLRDRALLEANVGASGTGVAVPALLGVLAGTALGWRPALLVPVVALAVLFARLRLTAFPAPAAPARATGRLPRSFWGPCLLVALAVAIEFTVIFYGVPLLHISVGLSTGDSAVVLSLFIAGELAGRAWGARLTRVPGRAERVVGFALGIAMAGFLALWLGRMEVLAAAALFVTGMGVGNLYPLSLAMALGAGQGKTDQAMARTQVAVGVAIGTAPLLLGVLSDHLGVLRALTVEPALIVVAALVLLVVARPSRAGSMAAAGGPS
ncbi:MAG: MFS transporter [Candidatus Dormibacteria bacterium]